MVDYNQQELEYLLPGHTNIGIGTKDELTSILGNPRMQKFLEYIKAKPRSRGITYPGKFNNFDIYLQRTIDEIPLSSKDIDGTMAHETAHQMQKIYNISYDISKGDYFIADPKLEISREINKYVKIDPNNTWAKSINEIDADLWKFRRLHDLDARDLITDEVKQFLNEYGDRHFEMDKADDNLIKWIQKLAAINVFSTKDK